MVRRLQRRENQSVSGTHVSDIGYLGYFVQSCYVTGTYVPFQEIIYFVGALSKTLSKGVNGRRMHRIDLQMRSRPTVIVSMVE
jgi:hypothetical protein